MPVALGLALACASVPAAFGADVRGRGFGWRQPVGVLGNVAIVIGIVPGAHVDRRRRVGRPANAPPGAARARSSRSIRPRATTACCTSAIRGCCRCPLEEYRDGIAFAVVDDGALDFTDRWAPPDTDADQIVSDALDHIADGSTLRAGALLAPHGIRYIVIPEIDGVESTVDDPVAAPAGLIEALSEQLDISATYGPPTIRVFAIGPWIPVAAQLTGCDGRRQPPRG